MGDHLGSADLRRALDVVHRLNADNQQSVAGLAELGRLVGADMTAYTIAGKPARRMLAVITDQPDQNPLTSNPDFSALVAAHPAFAAYHSGRLPLSSSIALTDLAERRALLRIPLYTDLYRPRGTRDQLLCIVRAGHQRCEILTFNRARAGFTERDRQLVDLLAPHVAQAMARHQLSNAEGTPFTQLTPREQQVAAHVCRGATDREIGRALDISTRTVHKHLERIFRKCGVTNRTSLIALIANGGNTATQWLRDVV